MADLNADLSLISQPDGPLVIVVAGTQEQERGSEPHRHARGQLFGSTRGLLSVGIDSGMWVMPATHVVWIPPHHLHWARSHGPFKGYAVYVAEAACASLPPQPCSLRSNALLREAVLRAATWPLGALAAPMERLAQVILDEIAALAPDAFGLPLPLEPRLQRIARELLRAPDDERSLEEWAAWGGTSARSLSRHFTAETGFSFSAWRQRVRLLRALEMLADGVAVSTIALELGYSTPSTFISLFRRTFGATPAVYRERLRAR